MTTTHTPCTFAEAMQLGREMAAEVPSWLADDLTAERIGERVGTAAARLGLDDVNVLAATFAATTEAAKRGHRSLVADHLVGLTDAEIAAIARGDN